MLNRETYVVIAKVLRNSKVSREAKETLFNEFCHVLKEDNPKFKTEKFFSAVYREVKVK